MSEARWVEVDLEVSSWLEGRGVRHTDWSVRVNDSWVQIKELRSVARTMAEPTLSFDDEVDELRVIPPGCQYRITFHVRLPVGSRVQRRISVPLVLPSPGKGAPETVEAAFQQLMAAGFAPKLPLKTTFTDFRVVERGLIAEQRWQARQRRQVSRVSPSAPGEQSAGRSEHVTRAEIEDFARRLAKVG
jgi:hypothetical protein